MRSSIFISMPELTAEGVYDPSPIKYRLRLDPRISQTEALAINYGFIRYMHTMYCNAVLPSATSFDRAQQPFKAMLEICEFSEEHVLSFYERRPVCDSFSNSLNNVRLIEVVKLNNHFPMVAINCTTNGLDSRDPRQWLVPNKGFMVQVSGSLSRDTLANKWITQVCRLLLSGGLDTGRYETLENEVHIARRAYKCRIVDPSGGLIQTVDIPLPTQAELSGSNYVRIRPPSIASMPVASAEPRVSESMGDPTHFIDPAVSISSEVRALVLRHSKSYHQGASVMDEPGVLASTSTALMPAPVRVSEDKLVESLSRFYVSVKVDTAVRSAVLLRQATRRTPEEPALAVPTVGAPQTVRPEVARNPEPPSAAGLCSRFWNYVCCWNTQAEHPDA